MRHRATLDKTLGDVPPIRSDPAGLSQVVLSLVTNAIQEVTEVALEAMGPMQVKGVREPVEVHRLTVPIVSAPA